MAGFKKGNKYVYINDIKVGVWAIEMIDLIDECVEAPIDRSRMIKKMEELKEVVFDGR